jgi:hypothetical protein
MAQTVDTTLVVQHGDGSYLRNPSNYIDHKVLAANVAETVTVPSGCKRMVPRSNADVFYRIGGTAAVPSGDVSDGEGSAFLTDDLFVQGIASFSVVCASACIVTFECYR